MSNDRGSVFPILAIVLVGGVLATLIAVELGRLASERRAISFAADMAAEAGAAMLDEDSVRDGLLALDPQGAHDRAMTQIREVAPAGSSVSAAASATEICVTISTSYNPRLLSMVGARAVDLAATSCAAPAAG